MKVIRQPYLVFFGVIPILLLVGVLNRDFIVDINVHDTYYVISCYHLSMLHSIIFALIGLGYWLMYRAKRKLSKWLNLLHLVATIGGMLVFWVSPFVFDKEYKDPYNVLLDGLPTVDLIFIIVTLMIVFGQLLYVFNMILGIFRKRN